MSTIKSAISYVYIVCCADNTLYCGYTTNLSHRLAMHNRGLGARYTRARLPVALVYYEELATKSDAMRREYEIKQLTRQEKITLINATM